VRDNSGTDDQKLKTSFISTSVQSPSYSGRLHKPSFQSLTQEEEMRKRQKRDERVQIQNNNKDHAVYYTLFMSISRGDYHLLRGDGGREDISSRMHASLSFGFGHVSH